MNVSLYNVIINFDCFWLFLLYSLFLCSIFWIVIFFTFVLIFINTMYKTKERQRKTMFVDIFLATANQASKNWAYMYFNFSFEFINWYTYFAIQQLIKANVNSEIQIFLFFKFQNCAQIFKKILTKCIILYIFFFHF